jgi:hypothetical protein
MNLMLYPQSIKLSPEEMRQLRESQHRAMSEPRKTTPSYPKREAEIEKQKEFARQHAAEAAIANNRR